MWIRPDWIRRNRIGGAMKVIIVFGFAGSSKGIRKEGMEKHNCSVNWTMSVSYSVVLLT